MNILGLTGGIGSGKSTVAKFFQQKGISVFNSDQEAKQLYFTSATVRHQVLALLGSHAYTGEDPNFKFIAQEVFDNEDLLKKLNQIIHPAVQVTFEEWMQIQDSPFVVKEAAILFESGAYKQCNTILTVTANQKIRISRVMKRDGLSREQVLERIHNQWNERRKVELSDFILQNNGSLEDLKEGFEALYPDISFRMTT